ncbi:histidine kinase [Saccharobesus litoralis]|uniref:Histidine kinase n=1 Tax=Saccharobesus litoralis TaxID=2172099 RepID=A0A2S0VR73_9ALTE|nr:histidine kinase [Saccharobesus litoralis]AWB66580.1 histidine kinase [Saccharobesus litoralis]
MKTLKHKKTRVLLEAIGVTLVFIALLGSSTFLVYSKSLSTLDQEIKIGLLSNVKSAASRIDGDLHKTFTRDTPRDDPQYLSQAQPLEAVRQASKDVRYIYTNILQGDKVYFVVNPSPQNDGDGDGQPDLAPALMDPYPDYSEELMQALTLGKAFVNELPYTDVWGTFISAYAPFYDSQGQQVGTLGMDLELSGFYQRLEKINIVFEKATITIVFLGLVVGLAVWFMRRSAINELENFTSLKQQVKHQQKTDKLSAQLYLDMQKNLTERFNQQQIDTATYLKQLTILQSFGLSFVQQKPSAKQEFDPEDLLTGIVAKLSHKPTMQYSEELPECVKGYAEPIKQQLSLLLQALDRLNPINQCQLMISEEQVMTWQLKLRITCQSNELTDAIHKVLTGDPQAFTLPLAWQISEQNQAWLWLHQVRNGLSNIDTSYQLESYERQTLSAVNWQFSLLFTVDKV